MSKWPRAGNLMKAPVTGWALLFRRPSTYGLLAFVVGLWAVVVASRVLWNGDVYGLDYSLWFPDGTYYAYKAFVWGGIEPLEATRLLNEMYSAEPAIPPGVPEKPPIYESRILYPLLSAPLALVIGPAGLLVVPALGLLTAVMVPTVMLLRRGLVLSAFVVSGLVLSSTSLARWTIANLTEGLTLGLFALMLPLLPWKGKTLPLWKVVAIGVLAVGISLTRQSLPVVLLLLATPWFVLWVTRRGFRNVWLGPLLAGGISSIAVLVLTGPRDGFWWLPISQDAGGLSGLSGGERLARLPLELVRMTAIEIGQLGVLDRSLLVLLILASVAAAWCYRQPLAWAWAGVAAGAVFTTAWVGAAGVNFRYALPLIPISMLITGSFFLREKSRLEAEELVPTRDS